MMLIESCTAFPCCTEPHTITQVKHGHFLRIICLLRNESKQIFEKLAPTYVSMHVNGASGQKKTLPNVDI